MGRPEFNPRLIHSKRGALIALCATGFLAALTFWDVFSYPQREHHWLLDFDWLALWHIALPAWAVVAANLGFYAGLLWGAVVLYRIAQGNERFLIVGVYGSILLGLIQILVSASAAITIDYLRVVITEVALFASIDILLRMPANGYPRADYQCSRNTRN